MALSAAGDLLSPASLSPLRPRRPPPRAVSPEPAVSPARTARLQPAQDAAGLPSGQPLGVIGEQPAERRRPEAGEERFDGPERHVDHGHDQEERLPRGRNGSRQRVGLRCRPTRLHEAPDPAGVVGEPVRRRASVPCCRAFVRCRHVRRPRRGRPAVTPPSGRRRAGPSARPGSPRRRRPARRSASYANRGRQGRPRPGSRRTPRRPTGRRSRATRSARRPRSRPGPARRGRGRPTAAARARPPRPAGRSRP